MPNWCNTSITFTHNDPVKLSEFYNKIDGWLKQSFKPNDFDEFSEGWLGNIVGNSGLAKWVKKGDRSDFEPNIACRGYVTDSLCEGNHATFNVETAWNPMMGMWIKLRDKYLPDAEISYIAEECGNGLFVTNDPTVIGCYYIDIYDEAPEDCEDVEMEYEASPEYTVKVLQKAFRTNETDIQKLVEMANDSDWIAVHEWEECSVYDFDCD